ncbi:hypothetical protein LTR53_008304 [Teratosphaeriaceae sp. CCFEE 6253]|nr:hypothetical protein LTR53_008304 [Teratosphaeriaceae sp. CCFEE 6253]
MKLAATLPTALLVTAASSRSIASPPILLQEPLAHQPPHDAEHQIPTIHESAVMARRIMHLSTTGTLVSTFPDLPSRSSISDDDEVSTWENRPPEMAGSPIGLMEYYADCEPSSGNPTLLAINIATPYRNHAAGSNISLQIRWWPTQTNIYALAAPDIDIPTPHTPAALPRFSLHGHLEPISTQDLLWHAIPASFLRAHPDSVLWQPGNDVHTSQYMRFVVEQVYWFGGFGDRARIGWLPIEEWRGVTRVEIEATKLPGEKDWEEKEMPGDEVEQEQGTVVKDAHAELRAAERRLGETEKRLRDVMERLGLDW